jgi:hypothetical protein
MQLPNHQHNSGKPPKRRLKPQALRAAKARRQALLNQLYHDLPSQHQINSCDNSQDVSG